MKNLLTAAAAGGLVLLAGCISIDATDHSTPAPAAVVEAEAAAPTPVNLIILYTLKDGVSPADFEEWVATRDHPTMRGLTRVKDFQTYRAEGLGEVSCLYTVSRLSGTGAGSLLVDGLLAVAGEAGLRDVFAVTVSEAAAAFFIRKGFAEVDPEHLPERKWATYDPERRVRARVFIRPAATVGEQGTLGF